MTATMKEVDLTGADLYEHLAFVFGKGHGYACIASLDRKDPKQKAPHHRFFQWPTEHANLVSEILRLRKIDGMEVWMCPYLLMTRDRTAGNAVQHSIVHADVDAPLPRRVERELAARGFRFIASGTPGHVQIIGRLDRSVSAAEHHGLEIALRSKTGADDKIRDNDLLRIPDTFNNKNDQRTRVTVVTGGRTIKADDVMAWLKAKPVTPLVATPAIDVELVPMPDDLPEHIEDLRHEQAADVDDRSEACYRAVSTVAEAGYTRDEIHAILADYGPGVDKYAHRWPRQIEQLLIKFEAKRGASLTEYNPETRLWNARPILKHIHRSAVASMSGPMAVLGGVLVTVLHTIPPTVHIPKLGGGRRGGGSSSLNLFVVLVGRSGAGKLTATDVAQDAIQTGHIIQSINVGSGEGISKAFQAKDGLRSAVLFEVPEVSTWNALANRTGATLESEVLKAFSGEALGFSNADETKNNPVPKNGYRMGLIIGAQPSQCDKLLGSTDKGFPQRFLWMPTWNNDRPDLDDTPPMPDPWMWEPPAFPPDGYVINVCDAAVREMQQRRHEQLDEKYHGDPLESHALLIRLRVAAALAFLDGRRDVTEEDWDIAELVMIVSRRTRDGVMNELRHASRRAAQKQGVKDAQRQIAAQKVVQQHKDSRLQDTMDRVIELLDVDRWRGGLNGEVTKSMRPYLDEALTVLQQRRVIEKRSGRTGGFQYRKLNERPG